MLRVAVFLTKEGSAKRYQICLDAGIVFGYWHLFFMATSLCHSLVPHTIKDLLLKRRSAQTIIRFQLVCICVVNCE